ncbi:MAG: type II toxin-antitoxin system PemK/MazF family toxin [Pyrinomonadaceae bacterium]
MAMVTRFDVYLVNLDAEPTSDAKNTRPCVVVSPDEMNGNISSVMIAPLSAVTANYPTRVNVNFLKNERSIVLDQLRTVDRVRLVKKIGEIEKGVQQEVLLRLREMFEE